jgi:hypothetical protein
MCFHPARVGCPRCRITTRRRKRAIEKLNKSERIEHARRVRRSRLVSSVLYGIGAALFLCGLGALAAEAWPVWLVPAFLALEIIVGGAGFAVAAQELEDQPELPYERTPDQRTIVTMVPSGMRS